ncbi:DotI/IcmL/TraM family protein, partial [Priestia megaterium]|uniref:DotI/IcmL/TraM family protein n=1 Tax=Priestia megaterium TaxID=1404 RepID=UPI0035B61103
KGRMILGLTILLVAMVIWNAVLSATRPEPKLLGMTSDGRIQELPLLDAPLDSQQVLFDWVRRNIPSLYDFNYA